MMTMDETILPKEGLIVCAVSGGPDSMYLLCRLREMGYSVAAAHFHHGLRGEEADRDEAFVRTFCREQGIACVWERGDTRSFAARQGLSEEAAARILRYDFLERTADQLQGEVIATAHTAGDNAETLLLRLARGTGLQGLAGIPPVRGRIVRPMLHVSRQEIEAYLAERQIPCVRDSSNETDQYARNRVRHYAVPALESVNPGFAAAAARTAELVREDEEFLQRLARDFLSRYASDQTVDAGALLSQPWPIASRAVRLLAGESLSREHVRQVLSAARTGGEADLPGMRVACSGNTVYFNPRFASVIQPRILEIPGEIVIKEAGYLVRSKKIFTFPCDVYKSYNTFFFQCEKINGNITITSRQPGDKFRPQGRGCTKKLKQLFQEAGIPPWKRAGIPVLRDERGILAVPGWPAAERVCAGQADRELVAVEIQPLPDEGDMGYAP